MQVLRNFTPNVEVYSIDESFLRIERTRQLWLSLSGMGQAIRVDVRKWTGVHACVPEQVRSPQIQMLQLGSKVPHCRGVPLHPLLLCVHLYGLQVLAPKY